MKSEISLTKLGDFEELSLLSHEVVVSTERHLIIFSSKFFSECLCPTNHSVFISLPYLNIARILRASKVPQNPRIFEMY